MGAFYLAPLVAASRGRSPVGWDSQPRRNWIVLDAHPETGRQSALLWLETPIRDQRIVKIAEDKQERVSRACRRAMTSFLGDREPRATWQAAVVHLLRQPPRVSRLGRQRWHALRPSKVRQQLEVHLGPDLFWSQPAFVGPNSKTFVDAFTRADMDLSLSTSSDGLFAWLDVDGSADFKVLSNALRRALAGANFQTCRADADLDTDDHYAQIAITGWSHIGGGSANIATGVLCRFTGAAGTAGYGFEVVDATTPERRIYRYDTDANIAADATLTTSGTIRLEVDGSSLTAKVNGTTVLGPSTDTTFATQLRTGISSFMAPGAAGSTQDFDSFEAGDIVAGGGSALSVSLSEPVIGSATF